MLCLGITQRFLFQRGSDLQRSSHRRVRLSLRSHRALKFVSCPGGSSYQKHSANLKRGVKALGNTAPFVPLLRAPRAGVTAESGATAASQASWDHSGHSCTNPFMEQKCGAESNMASVGVLCLMRHMSEPLTLCCLHVPMLLELGLSWVLLRQDVLNTQSDSEHMACRHHRGRIISLF